MTLIKDRPLHNMTKKGSVVEITGHGRAGRWSACLPLSAESPWLQKEELQLGGSVVLLCPSTNTDCWDLDNGDGGDTQQLDSTDSLQKYGECVNRRACRDNLGVLSC